MINQQLKKYIEKNIFPKYQKNDSGHNLDHIEYVIRRSMKFAKTVPDVNLDMVYTIAAYHDIGHHIDSKNHEKLSADIARKDKHLRKFFSEEEIEEIAIAIEDHRASKKGDPRTIYGRIVSSADRNDTVEQCLYRSYFYGKKLDPKASDQELYERAYEVLKNKFGEEGYAKFYFKDSEYDAFLKEIRNLFNNKETFIKRQREHILNTVFSEGSFGKHFKGKRLLDKNIYQILSLHKKGSELDSSVQYTGTKTKGKAKDLVIYQNWFNKKVFARELEDFYVEIEKDKQEEFGQMHRVEPLTEEELKRIQKEDFIIKKSKKEIKPEIRKYIEDYIFPCYENNDAGHGLEHIKYVIDRSLVFANRVENIDINMVYVIAAYHDIGHHIDQKNHEKVSGEMLLRDKHLREFFTEEEIQTMAEAVVDHRASDKNDPRNIYGRIVSTADRNVSIDGILQRTYEYRINHSPSLTLEEVVEESRQHIFEKFGKQGYATKKSFFDDPDYQKFLREAPILASDKELYRKRFFEVNGLNNKLKLTFDEVRRKNRDLSLDQALYRTYQLLEEKRPFYIVRKEILELAGIDELSYYTKQVDPALKIYIRDHVFPDYAQNDGGHNIVHILEVIRRSFALNDTYKLGLDPNMIYAIAACHDRGKYIDSDKHHLIAAELFFKDPAFKEFFSDEERKTIKEAIEDHRSSKEEEPRSTYGKLISSADRNTSIDIVFIRSFHVGRERMPDSIISDYLDYTIKRLRKKYDETNPENMFYEDQTYTEFLKDMRDLLQREEDFKDRYCSVNHITSRDHVLREEKGVQYTK